MLLAPGCPTVLVEDTKRPSKGDPGKYFYFSEAAFTKLVGHDQWSGKVFKITQQGSQSWSGDVKVWSNDNGVHGRRNRGDKPGQWTVGDTIKLQSCLESGICLCLK